MPQTQTTGHELYNIGHMMQGAIAYYRAPATAHCSMPAFALSMIS